MHIYLFSIQVKYDLISSLAPIVSLTKFATQLFSSRDQTNTEATANELRTYEKKVSRHNDEMKLFK